MEKQVETKLFVEGLNQDDSESLVSKNAYVSARNILISSSGTNNDGELQNIPDTTSIFATASFYDFTTYTGDGLIYSSAFPGMNGSNVCIGSKADTVKNRIYWFISNYNGFHGIFQYDYALNRVTRIAKDGTDAIRGGNVLNFHSSQFIHSIDFIHLSNGDTLLCWCEGRTSFYPDKPPRELHVERSISTYNWGSPIAEYILDSKRPPSRSPMPKKGGGQILLNKCMHMQNDGTGTPPFDFDGVQFMARYVYYNGNTSTWSSCSPYFPSKIFDTENASYGILPVRTLINSITLDLRDPLLYSSFARNGVLDPSSYGTLYAQFSHIIQYIELAFREDYNLSWKWFDRIPYANMGSDYVFKSRGNYVSLPFIETDQDFDRTPLIADTIKVAKNKKIYGNITENHDYDDTCLSHVAGSVLSTGYIEADASHLRLFRPNSVYSFGLEFFDEFGRTSSIYTEKSLILKTEDAEYDDIISVANAMRIETNLVAGYTAPSWAKGVRVKRTDNLSAVFSIRGLVNAVNYVSGYVKNNYKVYSCSDSTGGVHNSLNYIYTTVGNPPIDVLPGDKVTGRNIPEGCIVSRIFKEFEPALNSQVWKIEIFPPLSAGIVNVEITFQSIGIQASSYIYNQLNNNPAREQRDDVPWFAQTGLLFQKDFERKRSEQNRAAEKEQMTRSNIQQSAETLKNTDFQIGNPIYFHSNYYPLGETIDRPNHVTTLNKYQAGLFAVASEFKCKELHFDISNWFGESFSNPYIFADGDFISVKLLRGGSSGKDRSLRKMRIKGQRGNVLVVDCPVEYNPFDGGNAWFSVYLNQGIEIEVFREPIQQEILNYYDFGQTFFLPLTTTLFFGRVPTPAGTDSLSYMGSGDMFFYKTIIKSPLDFKETITPYTSLFMNPNTKKKAIYWAKDFGRPNTVFQNKESKVTRSQLIRWSLPFSQNSTINNTNRFIFSNQIEIPIDWGKITKIELGQDLLIIICEKETGTAFVDRRITYDSNGTMRVTEGDNNIDTPRKMDGQYGCVNPESVLSYNNSVYWISRPKAKAVRYSDFTGVKDITGQNEKEDSGGKFDSYMYKARDYNGLIKAGFDPRNFLAMWSYGGGNYSGGAPVRYFIDYSTHDWEVIAFNEQYNKWIGFYDYLPEAFANLKTNAYSFKNGELHVHGLASTYGKIYNQPVNASVEVVFNQNPDSMKQFSTLTQRGIGLWATPTVNCENPFEGGLMETSMNSFEWESINDEYWADVLFDKNTLNQPNTTQARYNGDPLIGRKLKVAFQNIGTTFATLFSVTLNSWTNKRTNS